MKIVGVLVLVVGVLLGIAGLCMDSMKCVEGNPNPDPAEIEALQRQIAQLEKLSQAKKKEIEEIRAPYLKRFAERERTAINVIQLRLADEEDKQAAQRRIEPIQSAIEELSLDRIQLESKLAVIKKPPVYVYNLQMAHNRSVTIGLGAVVFIAGVLLLGFGVLTPPPPRKPVSKKVAQQIDAAKLAEHRSEEMADDFLDSMR